MNPYQNTKTYLNSGIGPLVRYFPDGLASTVLDVFPHIATEEEDASDEEIEDGGDNERDDVEQDEINHVQYKVAGPGQSEFTTQNRLMAWDVVGFCVFGRERINVSLDSYFLKSFYLQWMQPQC